MCDKCDELDKKIEHYRSISERITDEKTIEGLKALIEACLAQRATLHQRLHWNWGFTRRSGGYRYAKLC
jgi:hypothetical protein